jgi:outer membrane protein assembly factor BamB
MKKCLLIISVFLPVMLFAQQNSQWRGENRDGVYNETGLLKVWAAGGPELLWSFEGLGAGFTSVAIAGGKIYVTGMTGDKLMLYVFDLNGKLLNKKEVGKEMNNNRYPGTRSTVCVNDGKLYIFNALGNFYCLDEKTLNVVWTKNLLKDFDGRNIQWGITESPLIVGDKLFLTPGGKKNNIVAVNKNTGTLIWSSTGTGMPSSYCSPLYIAGYSVPMIVTYFEGARQGRVYQNTITAFNANTGEMLWSYPQPSENDINPNTPVYHNGMIFSTAGYNGGSWMFRLTDGGKSAEQVWKNNVDNHIGGAVKVGDYVYTSGHRNRGFACIDWRTGEIKYRTNELSACAIVYADGMLYCYDDRGVAALVKPNPDRFELVSRFQITLGTDQHWAHPVIHNGVMYIRHGDAMMAYKVK